MVLLLPWLLGPRLRRILARARRAVADVDQARASARVLPRSPAVDHHAPPVDLAGPAPEPSPTAETDVTPELDVAGDVTASPPYLLKSDAIELSDRAHRWLLELRRLVGPDLPITVTSGTRSAWQQAAAMAAKLRRGEDLLALYRRDDLVQEILAAAGDDTAHPDVSAMALCIEDQVARRQWISAHLSGGALDLRTRGLSASQITVLALAARQLGARAVLEDDHLHVEGIPAPPQEHP